METHLTTTLNKVGFVECEVMACAYVHPHKKIVLVVHVDDIIATGSGYSLDWLFAALKSVYIVKASFMGRNDYHQEVFLGRTLRWTDRGIEWEANNYHVNVLTDEIEMNEGRQIGTPVTPEMVAGPGPRDSRVPMDAMAARKFRGPCAV